MATAYTDNFSFPLLEVGSDGWRATINGMLVEVDRLVAETRSPLIWEDDGSEYLLDNPTGKKFTTELLTYDDEPLFYI